MSTLRLNFPVYTLDNQLLFPKGTVVSEEALAECISSSRLAFNETHSLLRFGSIKKDLLCFLNQSPYNVIFAVQERLAELLNFMENIYVITPVLQSMDYFKQHDLYTYRHVLVVFALTTLLAKDLVPDYQARIREAATSPGHDFGKVCVPLEVLKKSTPLTWKERGILEHHTLAGYALLAYYFQDTRNLAIFVARDHHERRDGSGYPSGIPLTDPMVEIVAVSDIYDALHSSRPYRPISYDNRTALEEITSMAERNEIGWEIVRALVAHNRRDKPHFSECRISPEKRGTPPPGNLYGIITEDAGDSPDTDDN